MVKKWFRRIAVCVLFLILLFVVMHVDVRRGASSYTDTHPSVETRKWTGDFTIVTEGRSFYYSLFNDIKDAKHSVWVHFFIIREDGISNRFFQLLEEKALEGVDVRLSMDTIGSYVVKEKTMDQLKKSGVHVAKSRPLSLTHPFYSLHHRNHRRLITIDQEIAYIGGFNMGEEYLGKDQDLGYWRDYHIRIKSDGAKDMARQFAKDWQEDTKETLSLQPEGAKKREESSEATFQFLFTTGESIVTKMVQWIDEAEQTITMGTPYFLPDRKLINALKRAVDRGVEIKVLVPGKPDHWYTKPPSYKMREELIKYGVEFYSYKKGFFHGKVMVIDHKWTDIGTANWDPRSFYLNDESNCIIYDVKFAGEMEGKLKQDMEDSKRVTKKELTNIPFWKKLFKHTPEWIYYYF
jgi:cardiolipin synthase A/B